MTKHIATITLALTMPLCVFAQSDDTVRTTGEEQPEEVVITGERNSMQLRVAVMAAEKRAYDLFNQFNDEKRFDINCGTQQPTGSRFETQICKPNFELDAMRGSAVDYLDNYRTWLDPYSENKTTTVTSQPVHARIASQQKAYQRKMQQVAEEHPEFLEALVQYSELRREYEGASTAEAAGTGENK